MMISLFASVIVAALAAGELASPIDAREMDPCTQNLASYNVCDGDSIVFCQYDQPVAIADCFLAENTCKVVDGAPACVPRDPCTQNVPSYKVCSGDALLFCHYKQTVAVADCFLAGNTCKVVNGAPACVPP
ncbi:hypothetical protein HJFPF1_10339 [Paramyrothecium foliicola]|nr:hypothetical protein HJFPF1_10339 [Paramyrothecium foliicola]